MRILMLDLDTLRPDHLGCYGYHRNTSPNIDRVAQEGLVFRNYYCSDAPCLPSRAALISGQHGIHTGIINHGGLCADMRPEGADRQFTDSMGLRGLPATLRSAGLKTATVSPFADRHGAWWFCAGFDEMHNTGRRGMESAEQVTPTVLRWIEENGASDNWFLHVNYWDPHMPYRVPDDYGNPFEGQPVPEWLTDEVLEQHQHKVGPHSVHELGMYSGGEDPRFPRQPGQIRNRAELQRFFDGYDCGIHYMDSHIGRVLEELQNQGVLDDTVILITSDHGENLGEFGIYGEHGTADHITCRIPMIVRWPGKTSHRRVDSLHYNLDLLPTLAELLGVEPAGNWDGRSYAALFADRNEEGPSEPSGHPFLVLSQCAHVCQRSVRFGPWLYVRTYHDGYHLFPTEMLYNVEEDPHECANVADEYPEICAEAAHHLLEWHDSMMAGMNHEDPLWTVLREGGPYHARGLLPMYCRRLEETGRGNAVPELKRRHPGEFRE